MSIFNKIAFASLKKRKTQTIVTIVGVILSTAMICAVTTSVITLQNYMAQSIIASDGNWHAILFAASRDDLSTVTESDKVKNVSSLQYCGFGKFEGQNEQDAYIYVGGADENFFDMMSFSLSSGRFPENSNEILLPSNFEGLKDFTYNKIDTKIPVTLCDKFIDGEKFTSTYIPYRSNTELVEREEKTYTVVGFYENPQRLESGAYWHMITLADQNQSSYSIFLEMENPKDVYSYVEEFKADADINNTLLTYLGVSNYNSFYKTLFSLAAIIIVLIIAGSISLIYNAFSISFSERIKQFGVLSSIGATPKQLKHMVFFEAGFVSLVGIPIGVLSGVGGMAVTFHLLRNQFNALGNFNIPITVKVSDASILLTVILAVITIFISALIPAAKSSKITAIDAIRMSKDVKVTSKSVKTSKLGYKLFGLPGMLSAKYFKRSKRKYRTTIVSLFISIVLLISTGAFTMFLGISVSGAMSYSNYDIIYTANENEISNPSDIDKIEELLNSAGGIETSHRASIYSFTGASSVVIPNQFLPQKVAETVTDLETFDGGLLAAATALFIDDEEFKDLLKSNRITEGDYFNTNSPLALGYATTTRFDYNMEKFRTMQILKEGSSSIFAIETKLLDGYSFKDYDEQDGLTYANYASSEDELLTLPAKDCYSYAAQLNVGSLIKKLPIYFSEGNGFMLIYPESVKPYVYKPANVFTSFFFTSSDHKATAKEMYGLLNSSEYNSNMLIDYAASSEATRNINTIVNVFCYGFVVLISLIGAANVFNTVSTNITLRRREFATLRGIGMPPKEFNKMMRYECLLYGAKALLYALPVSFLIILFLNKSITFSYEMPLMLPWHSIIAAMISVFFVVFASMAFAMSRIKKEDTIEILKNENI